MRNLTNFLPLEFLKTSRARILEPKSLIKFSLTNLHNNSFEIVLKMKNYIRQSHGSWEVSQKSNSKPRRIDPRLFARILGFGLFFVSIDISKYLNK
jgi:hypothetical protein